MADVWSHFDYSFASSRDMCMCVNSIYYNACSFSLCPLGYETRVYWPNTNTQPAIQMLSPTWHSYRPSSSGTTILISSQLLLPLYLEVPLSILMFLVSVMWNHGWFPGLPSHVKFTLAFCITSVNEQKHTTHMIKLGHLIPKGGGILY